MTGSESSSSSCSDTRGISHPPASESPSGDESEASKQEPPPQDPRRLSKDDSLSSNSDSQQSSDEYFVYYYDPKSLEKSAPGMSHCFFSLFILFFYKFKGVLLCTMARNPNLE